MADTKLLTEIAHALLHGIQTTNTKKLDDLYGEKDTEFPEEEVLEDRITRAMDQVVEWGPLHGGPLLKPHVLYALVLALTHIQQPVEAFEPIFHSPQLHQLDAEVVLANLSTLGAALEDPDTNERFQEFVIACAERTNVREQRERRFTWFCKALSNTM